MVVTKIPKKTVTVIEPKRVNIVDRSKYNQLRVAAYCRVSTDSKEQLLSYENQKKTYTEKIAANKEWVLAGIYADEGISGTQVKKREHFNQMIKDCLAGKIDYIITKSVSRFARNTVDCLQYVRLLKEKNIGVIFEEQNIDTLKTESELYLVIYAGFAQSESENMSKNITWTFRNNFKEGKVKFNYAKLLGYKKGADGEPEVIPHEAEIIVKIFDWYLSGMSVLAIKERLKAEGHKTRQGSIDWPRATIQNILKNEKYCGDAILQKTYTIDSINKTVVKNDGSEVPMYYVHNNHTPIVSREVFNKTQTEMARRNAVKPASCKVSTTMQGKYSKYALTKLIHCAECGSVYRRVTWVRGEQKKVVWRCTSRLDYGKKYCKHSPTVDETVLHATIMRAIAKFYEEDSETYIALLKATLADAMGCSSTRNEIDYLERRVDALNKKMMNIVSESIANGQDVEDCEDEFKQISDEIAELKEQIKILQEQSMGNEITDERIREIQNAIDNENLDFSKYDDGLVRQTIECIRIYDNKKVDIIFGGGYVIEEML